MQSNQRFISYGAHKRFRRPSWKMAAYGLVPKKTYGMPRHIGHACENKQTSSVTFLVRAEFLNAHPPELFNLNCNHFKL